MNKTNPIRLSVIVSALVLCGTVAFAEFNPFGSTKASAALESSAQIRAIHKAQFTERDGLLSDLEQRVGASREALGKLTLSDALRDDLKKADDALASGIRKARDSSAENWEIVRSELAGLLSAYASVVRQADEATSK
ncbi:MAG: hypothetical protein C0518_15840 [Opitutus sp.]|nr:hypothetical protein [Opitutus sp.]